MISTKLNRTEYCREFASCLSVVPTAIRTNPAAFPYCFYTRAEHSPSEPVRCMLMTNANPVDFVRTNDSSTHVLQMFGEGGQDNKGSTGGTVGFYVHGINNGKKVRCKALLISHNAKTKTDDAAIEKLVSTQYIAVRRAQGLITSCHKVTITVKWEETARYSSSMKLYMLKGEGVYSCLTCPAAELDGNSDLLDGRNLLGAGESKDTGVESDTHSQYEDSDDADGKTKRKKSRV